MKRIIVHSDINHCYAQIEEMLHPAYRNIPMAVGGSAEKRHGIILAKNDMAKKYGIKTGEALHAARRKCPDLLIVHPDYEAYMYYTEQIKDIYRKYTDRVESFGLDEAWIDLTGSRRLFGDPVELARTIQQEVFDQFGITVSMGISWNKVFAKLGSDFDKEAGFTVIDETDWREKIWNRDAGDLVMVGSRTMKKLNAMGIFTIGDLARAEPLVLAKRLGKIGGLLWEFANGLDRSPVELVGHKDPVKSVGNSKTVVHDITTPDQLYEVFRVLAESVAARLRRQDLKATVVFISLRDTSLHWTGCQQKLAQPTDLAREILQAAWTLARRHLDRISLRSVGIQASGLVESGHFDQLSLFEEHPGDCQRQRRLETAIQNIRELYGYEKCRLASSQVDAQLTDFDPLDRLHQVHPVGYLKGPVSA